MFITVVGTLLIQIMGILPQWRAEKLPNGYRLVSIAPWEKFQQLSQPIDLENSGGFSIRDIQGQKAKKFRGLASGFRLTQITCWVLSVLWLLLLVNVAASTDYTWCILGVGVLGMFQNAWLAAVELPPAKRNMPLFHCDTIMAHKVMDGIMDFDMTYSRGLPLMEEFFPGRLHPEEVEWWRGNTKRYDEIRMRKAQRGISRSKEPVRLTSTLDPSLLRRKSCFDTNQPQSLLHIDCGPSTKWGDLRGRERPRKHNSFDNAREVDDDRKISEASNRSQRNGGAQGVREVHSEQHQHYEEFPVDEVTSPSRDLVPERSRGTPVELSNTVSNDSDYEQRARDATRSPAWS
ncbi:hypothetical protein PG993_007016 [Apiospora rasikravindrae]|uniref:Uncharacterized protein n=1 Tax=Apiospora rasikravindrae TaxID=990691 RepID=A0ABR1SWB1_9PEZI